MKLIYFSLFASALNVHALDIVDQGRVFEELARASSGARFEEVLKCGQQQTIMATSGACQFSCSSGMCMSTCQEPSPPKFRVAVEDCSADAAHIYGENGTDITVTREDFRKGGNTMVWSFLQDIGRYIKPAGKVVLTRMWPARVAHIGNGEKTTLDGYQIWGEIDYGPGLQRPQFTLTVLPTFKDLRQIGRLSSTPGSDFYSLQGIIDDEGF